MSLPSSSGGSPAATAAAAPPDDPPAVRVTSHGLRVIPYTSLNVWKSPAYSGVLDLPKMMAPAAFSRPTASASAAGTYSLSSAAPAVVTRPSVSHTSFTVLGSPCSGPAASPPAVAASAAGG